MPKKTYISPEIKKRSIEQLPPHLRWAMLDIFAEQSKFTVILDEQRRYTSVPQEFASLLGYKPEEMIGLKIDDITPPDTVDIDSIFREFLQTGKREGFWLFSSRAGKRLLVTYRAKKGESASEAEYVPLLFAA